MLASLPASTYSRIDRIAGIGVADQNNDAVRSHLDHLEFAMVEPSSASLGESPAAARRVTRRGLLALGAAASVAAAITVTTRGTTASAAVGPAAAHSRIPAFAASPNTSAYYFC